MNTTFFVWQITLWLFKGKLELALGDHILWYAKLRFGPSTAIWNRCSKGYNDADTYAYEQCVDECAEADADID